MIAPWNTYCTQIGVRPRNKQYGVTMAARGRLQSVWTEEDGLPVHTRISVDSVSVDQLPVWLVHGLSVSSRYMVPTAKQLAPHRRVYALDLPGFGRSAHPPGILDIPALATALARRMDAFHTPRAVLIGNSMGCQIIAELAQREPERVAQAVLVGPTMDASGRTMLEQARRLAVDALRESPASILTQSLDYLICGPRRTVGTLRAALDDRIEDKLPHMAMPTLLVRGQYDPIAPQPWCNRLVELLPAGELWVIPGAPHATNYVAPRRLARAILDFLIRTETQAEQVSLTTSTF